ncbi:hypothetical protein SAMN04487949_0281 [Halogranum gelatinilyticum]|uniref:Uncharacterized protein n=1 Tax=Halogranum gelatinilyticum TaxID=660521 RepID=A0A1G9P8E7_9EURY|nr:hypothetical protein [Halogranum gelatinilyticum]SDL95029.1 hypothetical protein SAMN04487949_0281 [Halogranum gelatinilyticum]
MRATKPLAALFAAFLVVTAGVSFAGAVAADAPLDVAANQQLDTGDAVVSVSQDGTAVADATVTVETEAPYAGNGTYATDANGTITLPNPNETVTANLTVTKSGQQTVETVELVPLNDSLAVNVTANDDRSATVSVTQYGTDVENATVNVTADGNYSGTGEYETDENGTVTLPAPNETVTVDVTATADDETAETTATLEAEGEADEPMNFGQRVSSFVHGLLGDEDREGGIGQQVSEFAKENNPGKGNGLDKETGRPDHAGDKDKDKDTGKPAHAGGPDKTDDGDNEDDPDAQSTDEDEDEEEDSGNGNAGNGNGNGNAGSNPGNGNGNAKGR